MVFGTRIVSFPRLALSASLLIAPAGCEQPDAGSSAAPPGPAAPNAPNDPTAPNSESAPSQADARAADPWNVRLVMPTKPSDPAQLGNLAGGQGLASGAKAPSVSVKTSVGEPLALADLWQKGPILLVFYRGGWCPFCNFQIREFVKSQAEYDKRGVTPVFISVDTVDESKKTAATYDIPFPVLVDPDLSAHRAFSVTRKASDAEVEKLMGYQIDIEKASGATHHEMAVPSIFLIDETGTVRWSHSDPDYKHRPSTEQLLGVLDARAP